MPAVDIKRLIKGFTDKTRTFPISGKFSEKSRALYDIVLRMQTETMAILREGVKWDDAHVLAHRIAVEGLLSLGVLKGGSVDEILEARTSAAFLPHGLGHYLGLDTHDTGGHPNFDDPDPFFRYLRLRGTLPAGSVVTVEPGVRAPVTIPIRPLSAQLTSVLSPSRSTSASSSSDPTSKTRSTPASSTRMC